MYELATPVNIRTVIRYAGQLLVVIGGILLVPAIFAVFLGMLHDALIFTLTAIATGAAGYLLFRFIPVRDLEWKEAMVVAALAFPLAGVVSAVPLALIAGIPYLDALFEAVSGITTTGLSVAQADPGQVFLFTRSWLQWVGGIGIVLLVLSVLVSPGLTARRLFSPAIGDQNLISGAKTTVMILFRIYAGITLAIFALLLIAGMTPFDAICQSFTTVSTGGFSTRPDSIAGFSGAFIPAIITIGCIMGATNFSLYYRVTRERGAFFKSIQVRWFFGIALIGIVLLLIAMLPAADPATAGSVAVFQAFSALTTSGFSTTSIALLPDAAKAVLAVLMWIGGGVGSTAGGIKVLRIAVLVSMVYLVFLRYFLPREAVTPFRVGGIQVSEEDIFRIVAYFFLYIVVLVASALIFLFSGFPALDSLFEVSSALGTVGLSTGITGAGLATVLKVTLIADMLLGRIEILPLLIVVMPRTWWKRGA
ncbi:trk system potassium uptake protein TrkH [Methanolinea mesophila]|uniref:TrkH family potassium uptake protein n=1 Tax=Methanolinea mesophila TaxID=547055 RepID=UPI001AE6765D|nr:TrkH family potassium uptake protein [Methanolinea mesophila]MBP1929617.1 trk system potassium uptake protein TrkH [Methanolinea mesophila]